MLPPRTLPSQGFLLVNLKSPLRKPHGRHHKWPRISSFCRKNNPLLSSLIIYRRLCNKSNSIGAIGWPGTVLLFGTHDFIAGFACFFVCLVFFFGGGRVARSLVFRVVLYRSMFVLFHLAILLSVLFQFKASDYPFWGEGGIFKLYLGFKCVMPFSTIWQHLQFYWRKKIQKITDLRRITDKLYHINVVSGISHGRE